MLSFKRLTTWNMSMQILALEKQYLTMERSCRVCHSRRGGYDDADRRILLKIEDQISKADVREDINAAAEGTIGEITMETAGNDSASIV